MYLHHKHIYPIDMGLDKSETIHGTSPLPFTNTFNASEHVATKDDSLCN